MITVAWSTRSDVGLRRAANEDSLVASLPVFAVADGMGGHAAGDVASAMAVDGLSHLGGHLSVSRREVLEAIRASDGLISSRALEAETEGMGTTVTGLAVTRSESGTEGVIVFNVGDSRTYLQRDGVLSQISHDHSVVQELIDGGAISAGEAETHPERNVITRSLGAGIPLDIDWWTLVPHAGDRFLLCSDGLFKGINDTLIGQILSDAEDRELAASTLLDAALEAGGTDNISLVIVDVVTVSEPVSETLLDGDTQPREADPEDDNTNPLMHRPVTSSEPKEHSTPTPEPVPSLAEGTARASAPKSTSNPAPEDDSSFFPLPPPGRLEEIL